MGSAFYCKGRIFEVKKKYLHKLLSTKQNSCTTQRLEKKIRTPEITDPHPPLSPNQNIMVRISNSFQTVVDWRLILGTTRY